MPNWIHKPYKFIVWLSKINTLFAEPILCICLSMPIQFSLHFLFQTTTCEPCFCYIIVQLGNQYFDSQMSIHDLLALSLSMLYHIISHYIMFYHTISSSDSNCIILHHMISCYTILFSIS